MEELVDAAREGQLVIFVGAGASRDEPSSLPDFKQLVIAVGEQVGVPPTDADLSHPDTYLGKLEDEGIDIKRLLADQVGAPGSRPNALHRALVRLADACGAARIVTTNYDPHLEDVASELGLELRQYCAPALPLGDNFEGIVHLHGSLGEPLDDLVASDKDFGRAYLLDAWAARFLERMFGKYVVLFVGYSHGDVVMQYIGRSLRGKGLRYICTPTPDDLTWRSLGLTPLAYAADGADHSELPEFFSRWADMAGMGQIAHRQTIHGIVEGKIPMLPEELSYMEQVVGDAEQLRYFVERAQSLEWLEWALRQSMIQSYVAGAGDPGSQTAVANWIIDEFMFDSEKSRPALALVGALPWSDEFAQAVGHALVRCELPIVGNFAAWLMLALQVDRNSSSDVFDVLLAKADWGSDVALPLRVFEYRTTPIFVPAPRFAGMRASRLDVGLPGHERWLTEAWAEVFVPALDEHLEEILRSVDQQLVRIYRARTVLELGFDALSYRRSAIEPHEQDSFRDTVDVLVDAVRECIERALGSSPDLAERYIQEWASREQAVFRRLALHMYRVRQDVSADVKLSWLEDQAWLWDPYLHHEVFLLLQVTVPSASPDLVGRLVSQVAAGPPEEERREYRDRRAYDLLGWLNRDTPGVYAIETALHQLQLAHSEWAQNPNPEFRHFMTSGGVNYDSPFPTEEFAEMVQTNPSDAVTKLRQLDARGTRPDEAVQAGIRKLVRTYATACPTGGLEVADELKEDDHEIMGAIIEGWQDATLDQDTANNVVSTINRWPTDLIRGPAARMLATDSRKSFNWCSLQAALGLADKLWPDGDVEGMVRDDDDLVTEAINHPAGDLASFWGQVMQSRWSESGGSWAGIPQELRTVLQRMLNTDGRSGLLAQTVLGGMLRFFYAADPAWTSEHLLPLFSWQRGGGTARGVWHGFLTMGRPDDGLLESGLLDEYIQASSHSGELPEHLRGLLNAHLVEIALFGSPDPLTWLRRFLRGSDEATRIGWIRELDARLGRIEPDQVVFQWDRWLSEYWTTRSESLPVPLGAAEASEMGALVVHLAPVIAAAADGLLKMPAALLSTRGLIRTIGELDLSVEPAAWACVLTHLLSNTSDPTWEARVSLRAVVEKLREADSEVDLTNIIEEAMRLGAVDAPEWVSR